MVESILLASSAVNIMPQIKEIMDETGTSEGTSLQVSSTSPEVIQNVGRALQVRETTSQASRSSSSSSSRRAVPATPKQQSSQLSVRNKTKKGQDGPTSSRSSSLHSSTHRPPRLGSHRGEGSIVPVLYLQCQRIRVWYQD